MHILKIFYFVPILHLILGKVTKFAVEKLSTSEVSSKSLTGGGGGGGRGCKLAIALRVNNLPGKQFQTIAVKKCSRNANVYQKQAKSHCAWPYWGVENEIIVFLVNEGSNRECCHVNKIFYILELLSSCFIGVLNFI